MATINPATAGTGQTLSAAAANPSPLGADFNMFLKLLTTQMQNQDPLDPMKTSEYTQQLAQYSQIEQTVQQGGTLKDILGQLSTQNLAQASGLIGRDAVFASPLAGLSAAPATWDYVGDRKASALVATISNDSGRTVDTRTLTPDAVTGRFSWDGALPNGGRAPMGAYRLSLAAQDANGQQVPVAVRSVGKVTDVMSSAGVVSLGVNGIAMPLASLIGVAAPAG